MYVVVWKYRIKSSDRTAFETEYGLNGSWSAFFRKSQNFIGSKLFAGRNLSYLIIDAWDTRQSYEDFLQRFRFQYESLSEQLKYLFEEEDRIGDFQDVNGMMTTIL